MVIVNMGSTSGGSGNGNVNGGSNTITTSATGLNGIAGSIAVVAGGTITLGNITANANSNGSSTQAEAGDLFLSPGVTSGTGITTGNINLNANTSGSGNLGGNVYFVVNSSVTATTGSTFSQSGGTSGNFL